MPGVMRLGPGEENEVTIGACKSIVVSVLSLVPTGSLQIAQEKEVKNRPDKEYIC